MALYQQQDEERRMELKALYQKQQRQKLHLTAQRAGKIAPLPGHTAASKARGTSGDTTSVARLLSSILETLSPAVLLDFRAGIWVMVALCNGCNGRVRVRLGQLTGAAPLLSKEVVK